jgi:hypothetical protein
MSLVPTSKTATFVFGPQPVIFSGGRFERALPILHCSAALECFVLENVAAAMAIFVLGNVVVKKSAKKLSHSASLDSQPYSSKDDPKCIPSHLTPGH